MGIGSTGRCPLDGHGDFTNLRTGERPSCRLALTYALEWRAHSGAHTYELPWADTLKSLENLRDERTQRLDTIIDRQKDDDRNRQSGGILLELQVLVTCEKNLELVTRRPEQFAVPQPRPAALLDGLRLVPSKFERQLPGQGFIKQDAHPVR